MMPCCSKRPRIGSSTTWRSCERSCAGPAASSSTRPRTAHSSCAPTPRSSAIRIGSPTPAARNYGKPCLSCWTNRQRGKLMQDEPWHVKRLRELEVAAPKRREKTQRFVRVPLWWIETAAKDARSPTTLVLIELLYAAWKAKSSTFPLPKRQAEEVGREPRNQTPGDQP